MSETVTVLVHHGDYRAEFVGEASTLEGAVIRAGAQSSYSIGIVPGHWGQFEEAREPMWQTLLSTLRDGQEYRDFGWCTFTRSPRCCDGTGWTGDSRYRCAEHFDAKSAIFAPRNTQ